MHIIGFIGLFPAFDGGLVYIRLLHWLLIDTNLLYLHWLLQTCCIADVQYTMLVLQTTRAVTPEPCIVAVDIPVADCEPEVITLDCDEVRAIDTSAMAAQ
jgi:hypothetical protein